MSVRGRSGARGRGRRACAAGLAAAFALTSGGCAAGSASPSSVTTPAGLQITLSSAHRVHLERLAVAADAAFIQYREWLGPLSDQVLLVSDPGAGASPAPATTHIVVHLPWRAPDALMEIEAQTAFKIARLWWRHVDDPGGVPLGESLAWYLQSRVVEDLFDRQHLAEGYRVDGARYFGDSVPWAFGGLRLTRWTSGLGREAFLTGSEAPLRSVEGRAWRFGVPARTARGALAFGTLERHLGWPVLQGALRVAVGRADVEALTPARFVQVLGQAAGQDLQWFFDQVFEADLAFDYAVDGISTTPSAHPCTVSPCHHTMVRVVRHAEGTFAGRASTSDGPYDGGDGVRLRVAFEDGQTVDVAWDGRAESRTFEFESVTPAVAASIDPDGVLLLDRDALNNHRKVAPYTNVRVAMWTATWLVWLQDAMLAGAVSW